MANNRDAALRCHLLKVGETITWLVPLHTVSLYAVAMELTQCHCSKYDEQVDIMISLTHKNPIV